MLNYCVSNMFYVLCYMLYMHVLSHSSNDERLVKRIFISPYIYHFTKSCVYRYIRVYCQLKDRNKNQFKESCKVVSIHLPLYKQLEL